ncbi:MAG: prolyl oligopeptidase family serine peptidase [Streptosporangiales bacterium]|nr:prolyl oligopeptidase family serine peptidase [Streptosporangiales bacterium]
MAARGAGVRSAARDHHGARRELDGWPAQPPSAVGRLACRAGVRGVRHRLPARSSPELAKRSWRRQVRGRLGEAQRRTVRGRPLPGLAHGLLGRGHLALLTAYTAGDRWLPPSCPAPDTSVRAVLALHPPTDLVYEYESEPSWRAAGMADYRTQKLETFTGGTPTDSPAPYRLASPAARVQQGAPPTLILHGGRDQIVPVEASQRLAGRLAAARVPHRLVEIGYADHAFEVSWGGFGSQISRDAIARFLSRYG